MLCLESGLFKINTEFGQLESSHYLLSPSLLIFHFRKSVSLRHVKIFHKMQKTEQAALNAVDLGLPSLLPSPLLRQFSEVVHAALHLLEHEMRQLQVQLISHIRQQLDVRLLPVPVLLLVAVGSGPENFAIDFFRYAFVVGHNSKGLQANDAAVQFDQQNKNFIIFQLQFQTQARFFRLSDAATPPRKNEFLVMLFDQRLFDELRFGAEFPQKRKFGDDVLGIDRAPEHLELGFQSAVISTFARSPKRGKPGCRAGIC